MNRETHEFTTAHQARLHGWRRIWRHTTLRPVAYLTVIPDPDAAIDGLIAEVPHRDWDALDRREGAYDRVPAGHQVVHPLPHSPEIAVYSIPEGKHGAPSKAHPALLSYIDTVVQGYLREFGEDGARRFFDTTHGWDAAVLNDRAAPVYPRHRPASAEDRAFVDERLRALSVRILSRD